MSKHRIFENPPQNPLRFVLRDGKRILQMATRFTDYEDSKPIAIGYEWSDVPLVEESPADGK